MTCEKFYYALCTSKLINVTYENVTYATLKDGSKHCLKFRTVNTNEVYQCSILNVR